MIFFPVEFMGLGNLLQIFRVNDALFFILRHIIKTYLLYFILAFIGIIFIAFYTYADMQMSQNTLRNVGIMIVLQQVYIFLKIWLKCTFLSSQMSLYKDFQVAAEAEGELIERRGEPFATIEGGSERK